MFDQLLYKFLLLFVLINANNFALLKQWQFLSSLMSGSEFIQYFIVDDSKWIGICFLQIILS